MNLRVKVKERLGRKFDEEIRFFKGWMSNAEGGRRDPSDLLRHRPPHGERHQSRIPALPVLELGPGTGVITKAILERGLAAGKSGVHRVLHRLLPAAQGKLSPASTSSTATPSISSRRLARSTDQTFDSVVSAVPLLNFPMHRRVELIEDLLVAHSGRPSGRADLLWSAVAGRCHAGPLQHPASRLRRAQHSAGAALGLPQSALTGHHVRSSTSPIRRCRSIRHVPVPKWGLSEIGAMRAAAATARAAVGANARADRFERRDQGDRDGANLLAGRGRRRRSRSDDDDGRERPLGHRLPAARRNSRRRPTGSSPIRTKASRAGSAPSTRRPASRLPSFVSSTSTIRQCPIAFVGHGGVGTLLEMPAGAAPPIARSADQKGGGGGNLFAFRLADRALTCDWTPMEFWQGVIAT